MQRSLQEKADELLKNLLEENQKSKIGIDSANKEKEYVGQKVGDSLINTKNKKKAKGK